MPVVPIRPYWQTPDGETVRLYLGNVTDVLARLPEKSVQCVCTSPPYWGLRDYGTGTWEGGDPTCQHASRTGLRVGNNSSIRGRHEDPSQQTVHAEKFRADGNQRYIPPVGGTCDKCGARRIDCQIGSEPSPDCGTHGQAQCGACFVCSMVGVFRGVRRVLRDDGVLWLNLGDSYTVGGGGNGPEGSKQRTHRGAQDMPRSRQNGLSSGNLVGVPWRVALALQHDGWTLRSDLPWVKRSSMPESVTNRPAKALEYVFMFCKGPGYYFDMEAVRKQMAPASAERYEYAFGGEKNEEKAGTDGGNHVVGKRGITNGRNFRQTDLWFESVDGPYGLVGADDELVGIDVTSRGYPGRHFAVYPEWLIDPLIRAATSEKGACGTCGAPWERMTDGWQPTCECHGQFVRQTVWVERPVSCERDGEDPGDGRDRSLPSNRNGKSGSLDSVLRDMEEVSEEQWVYVPSIPLEDHPVRPCRVLDPFIGSGTTCIASLRLGRWSWGVDLSEQYLREHAVKRVGERLVELNGPAELVGFNSAPVTW